MEEKRNILSVTELNRAARLTLENGIGEVWVEGEISRLTQHSSGHWYFTLKDEAAAVRAENERIAELEKTVQDLQENFAELTQQFAEFKEQFE